MRFGAAEWLWLLLLIPLLGAFFFFALRSREKALARWCRRELWNRMVAERSRPAMFVKAGLVLLAVLFLVLMAARPQIGNRMLSVQRKGIDVMIALDVSESMLAEDLPPNRITRARQEVQTLIDRLRGDRVGLIAFAGEAFVQCPLTLDYSAARMFLRFMDTDLIPVPGTALAEAVRAATRSFDPKERKFKALVLITDGEDHEGNVEKAAEEAKEAGVRIFAVGIGTTKGEPIPETDPQGGMRDFKRDRAGNVVMTKLDSSVLRSICETTGGRYYDGSSGGLALDRLYGEIAGMEQKELKGGIVTQYEDRYGYFAGAALFLLALESILSERRRRQARGAGDAGGAPGSVAAGRRTAAPGSGAARGRDATGSGSNSAALPILAIAGLIAPAVSTLLSLLTLLVLLVPARAFAADPGMKAYSKGDFAKARDAYEQYARQHPTDPRADYNLGTALHQTGEMSPAEENLRRALRSPDPKLKAAAFYNLGNTRARANNLEGARDAYRMSLRLNPSDKDAKYNLELVESLLQQQPPDSSKKQNQQQNKNDQKNQDKKDQQKQDQKDQNKDQKDQNQDQKDQNKQDQKNQDQQQQQDQQKQDQQKQDQQKQDQQQSQQNQQQQQQQQQQNQDRQGGDQKPMTPLKISPEEARQILNGLAQQEMLLQKERLRAKSHDLRVEKDW